MPDAWVYTDEHGAYGGLPHHQAVYHSKGEYVRGDVHTNGIEGAWAIAKRMHMGTYHQISSKHLHRYINELSGRHNQRPLASLERMDVLVRGVVGKRLRYRDLIAGGPAYGQTRKPPAPKPASVPPPYRSPPELNDYYQDHRRSCPALREWAVTAILETHRSRDVPAASA